MTGFFFTQFVKRENSFLRLKKGLAFFLGPFRFKVTNLARNLTFLTYMALPSDLATTGVQWGAK
jgi:hypothetical protein